jgi:hypothetical protein
MPARVADRGAINGPGQRHEEHDQESLRTGSIPVNAALDMYRRAATATGGQILGVKKAKG